MNKTGNNLTQKMTNYRWTICIMMFLALTVNYLDRQVLSLTWDEFIKPEFHWNEIHYGYVTATFSIVYAIGMLFAGRAVDWLGTKAGFLWSFGIWSAGACLHALCGVATELCTGLEDKAQLIAATGDMAVTIATISMYFFLAARCVLAIGEAGYFPAAVKVTAEYFPKRDRAFATSIFNAGASIGALFAPLTIPLLAKHCGWEMAFVIIGVMGFVWMGFWVFMYKPPRKSRFVNAAELEYIEQDKKLEAEMMTGQKAGSEEKKMPLWQCFRYRQTWAFVLGKFCTDGVWWFFLFWTPSYLNTQFGIKTSEGLGMALIFTLYAITMLSLWGGKLPTIFINRTGSNPYAAGGALRAAVGHAVAVVSGDTHRYRLRRTPVVVGQHLHNRERHVPQESHRHRHRHRRNGRRHKLDAHADLCRQPVCVCRQGAARVHGLHGQAGRILHNILYLLCGLSRGMDHHEDTRAEIQAHNRLTRQGLRQMSWVSQGAATDAEEKQKE